MRGGAEGSERRAAAPGERVPRQPAARAAVRASTGAGGARLHGAQAARELRVGEVRGEHVVVSHDVHQRFEADLAAHY